MYDEPYRWVEAVSNRRQYLEDQFAQGSPVVALSFVEGILFLTFSHGTPKLYEIYDRIGLGGMGHPADLEKLRFSILDMAHVEGFQRSPGDVTGSRLVKYGLAPVIKQAFEEIFKAPYICKILLGELGLKPEQDRYITINYDGTFNETVDCAVLGATQETEKQMLEYLKTHRPSPESNLPSMIETAARSWAMGTLHQRREENSEPEEKEREESTAAENGSVSEEMILDCLRETLAEKTLECAILERNAPGSSKFRTLSPEENQEVFPDLYPTPKK